MKRKHKLTPQIHKQIIESAKLLPKLVKLKPDGITPEQHYVSKKVRGYELEEGTKIKDGSKINPNELYKVQSLVQNFINHEVEMINLFWQNGEDAVKNYIVQVNNIYQNSLLQK